MSETTGSNRTGRPKKTWALLISALALLAAGAGAYRMRQAKPENPLEGDAETAVAGIADVMEKTPPAERIPMLRRDLQDPNPGLRFAAVETLGGLKDPAVIPDMQGAFKDSSAIVRMSVLENVWKIDSKKGLTLLISGLKDEDNWVRDSAISQIRAAVQAKSKYFDKSLLPVLMQNLASDRTFVMISSLGTLRTLTGNPWSFHAGMSGAERKTVLDHWFTWWKENQSRYPDSEGYLAVNPIQQDRSDPSPSFQITDLDGKQASNATLPGRVTLLSFWGTWCPPCQGEVPDLVKLDDDLGSKGLDILGIAVAETGGAGPLRKWCQAHHVSYRQFLATPDIQKAFGNIEEVPVSVLIDKKGQIRYRWDGERDYETFEKAVSRLLKE